VQVEIDLLVFPYADRLVDEALSAATTRCGVSEW
jgi:hypothetical protein